eukprot:jgi/Botrbrau1/6224/Bobra.0109s0019.1
MEDDVDAGLPELQAQVEDADRVPEEGMGGNFKRVLKVITDQMKEDVGKLSRERCLKNKPMKEYPYASMTVQYDPLLSFRKFKGLTIEDLNLVSGAKFCIFCPVRMFPEVIVACEGNKDGWHCLPCPECHEWNTRSQGWGEIRVIVDVLWDASSSFYHPNGNATTPKCGTKTFQANHPNVLENLPGFIKDRIPGKLEMGNAMSYRIYDILGRVQGHRFLELANMFEEASYKEYYRNMVAHTELIEFIMSTWPKLASYAPIVHQSAFAAMMPSKKGVKWRDLPVHGKDYPKATVSAEKLKRVFLEDADMQADRRRCDDRMGEVASPILRADHHHKLAKKMGYADGDKQIVGAFGVMGQYGQIRGIYLTPNKSLTPLQGPLTMMAKAIEEAQGAPVQYFYVDNINVVRKDIEACMPDAVLKEDHYHAMARVSKSVNPSQCFDKTYANDVTEGLDWIEEFSIVGRRICPAPRELTKRLADVLVKYQDIVDVDTKQHFFTQETGYVFERLLASAEAGYLSDPEDMDMYKTIMKGGLTLYMSHRGTSQIEGLHSHLNRLWVGACHISLALGIELYRARALRWNHDRLVEYFGMRHPGVYTYGLLEKLITKCNKVGISHHLDGFRFPLKTKEKFFLDWMGDPEAVLPVLEKLYGDSPNVPVAVVGEDEPLDSRQVQAEISEVPSILSPPPSQDAVAAEANEGDQDSQECPAPGPRKGGVAPQQNRSAAQQPHPTKKKRKVQHSQPRVTLKRTRCSNVRATLLDFLTPVKTAAEKHWFWELMPLFKKGKVVDWKQMALEWNRRLTDLLENGLIGPDNRNHLFFKHYTDLEKFGKTVTAEMREWETRHRFHAVQALEKLAAGVPPLGMMDPNTVPTGLTPYLNTPRDEPPKRPVSLTCPSATRVLSTNAREGVSSTGLPRCIIDLTSDDSLQVTCEPVAGSDLMRQNYNPEVVDETRMPPENQVTCEPVAGSDLMRQNYNPEGVDELRMPPELGLHELHAIQACNNAARILEGRIPMPPTPVALEPTARPSAFGLQRVCPQVFVIVIMYKSVLIIFAVP